MTIKKLKPMFTNILTTANKYAIDDAPAGTLITDLKKANGSLKEYQKVLAVGRSVTDIKVGDWVMIETSHFEVHKKRKKPTSGPDNGSVLDDMEETYQTEIVGYRIPLVEVDGKECLYIREQDVKFIIEDLDENDEPSPLIIPSTQIIQP